MDVINRPRPGQPGTKRLQRRFGERLLFVGYRHDAQLQRRFTTVELIVDEGPRYVRPPDQSRTPRKPNDLVHVRVAYDETTLRAEVKAAGGTRDPKRRLWSMPYRVARTLGLTSWIEPEAHVQ